MSSPLVAPVTPDTADPKAAAMLNAVKAKLGMIPNLYATLAHSPAALDAALAIGGALGAGRLTAAEREIIALATAQVNGCQYCLSAHTLLATRAGLSSDDVVHARNGSGQGSRAAAIAALAKSIAVERGHVSAEAIGAARDAGLTEGELMEIVVGVAANVLTNFTNNLARTTIDFPVVAAEV